MIERSGSGGPPGHQAGPGGDKHKQVTGPPPLQEGASLGPGEPHTPPLLPADTGAGQPSAYIVEGAAPATTVASPFSKACRAGVIAGFDM